NAAGKASCRVTNSASQNFYERALFFALQEGRSESSEIGDHFARQFRSSKRRIVVKDINTQNDTGSTDRRSLLKNGSAVAGGLLLPAAYSSTASAQGKKEYPKLGNYPDGVAGDTVVAGLTLDLTGPYSAEGAGQKRGFELAAELINNGDPRVKKVS